jgi:hypothetical protein
VLPGMREMLAVTGAVKGSWYSRFGITGMGSIAQEPSTPHSFTARVNEPDHRFDVGVDLIEPILNCDQSSENVVIRTTHRFAKIRGALTLQYRNQVPRVPLQRRG